MSPAKTGTDRFLLGTECFCPLPQMSYVEVLDSNAMALGGGGLQELFES